MRFLTITAFLAVTATALRPTSVSNLIAALGLRVQRPRSVLAHALQDLPAGWTTGLDEASGMTYYFNEQTGQSQWEPPHGPQVLPAGWTTGIDQASGLTYYFHEQTGQAQWEPPLLQDGFPQRPVQQGIASVLWHVKSTSGCTPWVDKRWTDKPRFAGKYELRAGEKAVLGRYDVDEKKVTRPWVSRMQCAVQVTADGIVTLVSLGRPPTGWRARDGEAWQWLLKDEAQVLAEGAQVSLDYQDPEGTVLACQAERG